MSPDRALNNTEYQEYTLVLNLKWKPVLATEEPRAAKQPRNSFEGYPPDTSFPVILSQEEKDQIVVLENFTRVPATARSSGMSALSAVNSDWLPQS
jgi:hypothetical protein